MLVGSSASASVRRRRPTTTCTVFAAVLGTSDGHIRSMSASVVIGRPRWASRMPSSSRGRPRNCTASLPISTATPPKTRNTPLVYPNAVANATLGGFRRSFTRCLHRCDPMPLSTRPHWRRHERTAMVRPWGTRRGFASVRSGGASALRPSWRARTGYGTLPSPTPRLPSSTPWMG